MAPYPVGIAYLSLFVHEDRETNAKLISIFLDRLYFLFDRDLNKDEVRILELVLKFRKGRRLLPAGGSPCCEKIQEYDLPSKLL
jgi:hypothetical protein